MSGLGIVVALAGVLIVAGRLPLVIAPQATLDWFLRLIRSDSALRGVAALLAALGVALFLLSHEERGAVGLFSVLGCLWALAALWMLVSPTSCRRLSLEWLEFFRSSVDSIVVRGLGAVGVAIGLALIYIGLVQL
jgi:hypothetical protein